MPPTLMFLGPRSLADLCFQKPRASNERAKNRSPPTTASPAMTPPLSWDPPCTAETEVELPLVSITLCRTHSPKVQPSKGNPPEPKSACNVDWPKEQLVARVSLLGGAHETVSVPPRSLITAVKFVAGTAPQKEVFGRQVHCRFWHVHTAPSPSSS